MLVTIIPLVEANVTLQLLLWYPFRPGKFDVPTARDNLFFLSGKRTMIFLPSDSIYVKANTVLGTGLTVIQSKPS